MKDALPPAMLIADSPGLDFLNSIATPVDTPVEWLHSGEGLLSWLEQAGLIAPALLKEIRDKAGPGELDSVAAEARALREWFRLFVQEYQGRPLPVSALAKLEPLNRVLARDEEYAQIMATEKAEREEGWPRFKLVRRRRWRSASALLQPIAEAMAEVVASADFAQVKHCEGASCTLCFYDTTRRHARRWCSMAVCGNRAKQAAHRDRIAQGKS
jgi:predicted RNA-binding Zn ribbon-like protein